MAKKEVKKKLSSKSKVDEAIALRDTLRQMMLDIRVVEAAHGNIMGTLTVDERIEYDAKL